MRNVSRRVRAIGLSSLALAAFLLPASLRSQENTSASARAPLTASEIVKNLEERNRTRTQALHRFEGSRTYSLHYRGFPHSYDAEMVVNVTYQSPANKEFTVVSQSGSKLLIDHVLKKMIESEKEAVQQQSRTELTEQNYEFTMAGYEETPQGANYVLSVSPRSKNKFLYRGKIWVDASDFAVTRIEAAPAQNPSFWIKKTDIRHAYKKVGDFWLPAENHSQSSMRVGGRADLSIEYKDYKIIAADPLPSPTERLAHTAAPKPVAAE